MATPTANFIMLGTQPEGSKALFPLGGMVYSRWGQRGTVLGPEEQHLHTKLKQTLKNLKIR